MSLEAALTRNNELIEKQNDLLAQLLGKAGTVVNNAASSEEGEKAADKPKGRGKAADKAKDEEKGAAAGFEISYADLSKKLSAWLAEFAKKEDKENPDGAHPEVPARKAALKECFGKLKVSKLGEMENDAKKLTALNKWFEEKAKVDDHVGAGAGRFAADPSDDADDGDSDDIGDL